MLRIKFKQKICLRTEKGLFAHYSHIYRVLFNRILHAHFFFTMLQYLKKLQKSFLRMLNVFQMKFIVSATFEIFDEIFDT